MFKLKLTNNGTVVICQLVAPPSPPPPPHHPFKISRHFVTPAIKPSTSQRKEEAVGWGPFAWASL